MPKAEREKLGQPDYDLVPVELIDACARALEYGADKYAPRNWENGLPTTQICSSLTRHVFAYMRGEDVDSDSGLSHVDLIVANAAFLAYHAAHGMCDSRRPEKNEKEK